MQASPQEPHRKPDNQSTRDKTRLRRRKLERGFQEIPLYPTGYQDGKKRFPQKKSQQAYRPPKINLWRNNLTACSQYHNLYFVACLDWIYVYKPQHPSHSIPEQPLLKWLLPVTKESLPGYISPISIHDYSPHSVNNMLVADLGSKEVIFFACDDGDVLGYNTDVILGACHGPDDNIKGLIMEPCVERLPKAFFHQNVGKSAWGLAVHKEARLIAVSSNSHNVTVFALGLDDAWHHSNILGQADDDEELKVEPKLKTQPCVSKNSSLLQNRQSNHLRVLKRHSTNIPSISFCNTPEDPQGRYLASTDISGVTIVWDVDTGKSVRLLGPLRQGSDDDQRHFEDYDSSRDGWGVLFLDARSFSRTKNIVQAMGTCFLVKHDLNAADPQHSLTMYDISESQPMVRNSAAWTVFRKPLEQDGTEHDSTPNLFGFDSSRYIENSDDEDEEIDHSTAAAEPGSFPTHERLPTNVEQSNFQKNKRGIIPEDQLGPGISQRDLMDHKWSIFSHYTIPNRSTPESHLPRTPLMLLNPRKIHLFQSPNLNLRDPTPSAGPYPVIHFDDPLAQHVPPNLAVRLNQLDRLNLYAQIPDLGVVLVGSPKGRVAVLTLHLLEPQHDPDTGQLETDIEDAMYTMRLDHLLPFKEQEERGLRPLQPLVGIATSPVFGVDSRRPRYRIFLSYLNHTVLAYEIGREGSGCGGFSDVFAF